MAGWLNPHPCHDHIDACDHCHSCDVLGVCCRTRSHSHSSVDAASQLDDLDLTAAWHRDQGHSSPLSRALELENRPRVARHVPLPFPEPATLTAGGDDADSLTARLSRARSGAKALSPSNNDTKTTKENSND